MSDQPLSPRAKALFRAIDVLKELPGDWEALRGLLFQLAVTECARTDGKASPHEPAYRRALAVELVKLRPPAAVLRALGF